MRLNTTDYQKQIKYPRRDPQSGFYHGYGGVRAWTPPTRDTSRLRTILCHTTDNPQGNTHYRPEVTFLLNSPDVSAHYVVSSHDDTIVQLLPDEYIAWHAGDCADNDFENLWAIGVEIAWTKGKGPLPQIAIDTTTDLVRMLLNTYPSIVKIDTHRAQAVPRGRKPDPIGWEDADFYRWRDRMLRERGTPPTPIHSYTAVFSTPVFTSRERPDTVALGGTAVIKIGDRIETNDLTSAWLHISPTSKLYPDVGFVPVGAFVPAP